MDITIPSILPDIADTNLIDWFFLYKYSFYRSPRNFFLPLTASTPQQQLHRLPQRHLHAPHLPHRVLPPRVLQHLLVQIIPPSRRLPGWSMPGSSSAWTPASPLPQHCSSMCAAWFHIFSHHTRLVFLSPLTASGTGLLRNCLGSSMIFWPSSVDETLDLLLLSGS